jgi:prepilin-type N-terminal cleavage/methylation domain-containing protein
MTRRFSKNNGGFSLIELLVAVAILVAVVGIIGRAFVLSTLLNRKGRDLGDQTLAAQNIIEMVKIEGVKSFQAKVGTGITIVDGNPFSFLNNGAVITPHGSEDLFRITGVTADNSTFDAELEFDQTGWDHLNVEYTDFIDMNIVHFSYSEEYCPDEESEVLLASLAEDIYTMSVDEFLDYNAVRREVILNFERDAVAQTIRITVKYVYAHTPIPVTPHSEWEEFHSFSTTVGTSAIKYDDGTEGDIPANDNVGSVYLCNKPYTRNPKDLITINNPGLVDCYVYLIGQNDTDSYSADIELFEPTGANSIRKIKFYTNFTQVAGGSFKGFRAPGFVDDSWASNVLSDTNWIKKTERDRMYNVTVRLFPRGGTFTNPITTITATHLEYTLVEQSTAED